MTMTAMNTAKHAGLLIPLEMFRPSQLASIFGEILVGKARNVLDAKLVIVRHPTAPILLMRIEGSVIDGNPAAFWRDNPDLVSLASRAFPRQVIMYYSEPAVLTAGTEQERREGFTVAQQGQVLAGDDATAEQLGPNAAPGDWPLARLCEQLKIDVSELQAGFVGGASVEVKLIEPDLDDQALLMTLFQKEHAERMGGEQPGGQPEQPEQEAAQAGANPADDTAPPKPKKLTVEEDTKRRAAERAEEVAAQEQRASEMRVGLAFTQDEHGLVVAPDAELSEPDLLQPFVVATIDGDLPPGLPRELTDTQQGKRLDIAVKVDFLSEVFVGNVPLSKPAFAEAAEEITVGGQTLRALAVLGPRIGYGTLLSRGKAPHVFVSRKLDMPLPEELILGLLS